MITGALAPPPRRRARLDAACLRDDARRMWVLLFAVLFGSEDLRDRVARLAEGGMGEDEARVLRGDLDAMARQLLG